MKKRQETAEKSIIKTFRRFPASSYIDQQNTIVRLWHFADSVIFIVLNLRDSLSTQASSYPYISHADNESIECNHTKK